VFVVNQPLVVAVAPHHEALDATSDLGADGLHLVVAGGQHSHEADAAIGPHIEDTVGHEGVEVNIDVERTTGPLHERHGGASAVGDAHGARHAPLPGEDTAIGQ